MGEVVDFYRKDLEHLEILTASDDDIRRVTDAYLQSPTPERTRHLERIAILRAASVDSAASWYAMAAAEVLLGDEPYESIEIMLEERGTDDSYITAAMALLLKSDPQDERGLACMEKAAEEMIAYLPDHEYTPAFLGMANHYLRYDDLEERLDRARKDLEFARHRRKFRT